MSDARMGQAAQYVEGRLCIEGVSAGSLAEKFGTPLYVYSASTIRSQYAHLASCLRGLAPQVIICYALKANGNVAIGSLFRELGAGADIVSGGELYLAQRMGFQPQTIVFAGVGKTRRELAEALRVGIGAIHVESAAEAAMLGAVAAEMGVVAPVTVRVNPDVDAHTHRHITTGTNVNKFGVAPEVAATILRDAARSAHMQAVGLHVHIGSQLASVAPIVEAVRRVLTLWDTLSGEGIMLRELDIGGGLGIAYRPDEEPEGPEALAAALHPLLKGRDLMLVLEPGRYLVGSAGVLLATVTYLKGAGATTMAVVDAGMNDLIRPALYDAWHPVWPADITHEGKGMVVDIVGPVCESADVLAKQRNLGRLKQGDIIAIGQAGAYGFSMASQYNGRPRPAEVLVEGEKVTLIRKRESYQDLVSRV